MIFHSIRWRLQSWHGLILVLVLAAFGYSAYSVARDNQLRRIDEELQHRLGSLFFRPGPPSRPPERRAEPPPGPSPNDRGRDGGREGGPDFTEFLSRLREAVAQAGTVDSSQTNGFYYVLWQEGTLLAQSLNAPADVPAPLRVFPWPEPEERSKGPAGGGAFAGKSGPPQPPGTRERGDVREVFRYFPHGECILVGHFMAPELAAMRRLAIWLGAAGAGVLLLGWAGGWWVSTRAIRPIEEISATATKIAAGDLSQRINAADTDNELGRLAGVLNSTFARLEAAFANQARFTGDASHELRTPVSVILSQTQGALSRERSGPDYREALEACQRAAQRMRGLTESLLELARLDAGQAQFKHEPFDLSQVTTDCIQLLRPLANERGITIESQLPPAPCVGDAQRISQVATNLLSNAIQFNREHGQVKVAARVENGTAILTVTDTGQGIPPDDLPHIFERFYRVDKSRSRVQGRTGLGLAIAKAIVEGHGGTIEVASHSGTGSAFTVRLRAR
ncbi:MAG TPA: ATP-binding protein [Verrucomicrobiae bacterium]